MTHSGQLGDDVGLGEVIPGRGLQTTPTPGKPTLYALRPPMLVKNVGGILFRSHIIRCWGRVDDQHVFRNGRCCFKILL